jgi:O-methyltransferase
MRVRSRDIAIFLGSPHLHSVVHRARSAGLETLLDYQRLSLLRAAVRCCRNLEGEFIEFGTYRGGSAAVIGQELRRSDKVLHLCDSFKGLPPPSAPDNYHTEGDFDETSEARVVSGLRSLGVHAQTHVGFFHETLPHLSNCRFALAHIDVDLYESVNQCLTFCYPRMTPGGIIILDDYGSPTCMGAKTAVDEFFADRLETVVLLSQPAHGVWIGTSRTDLLRVLCRRAGWISAMPVLGEALYRQ